MKKFISTVVIILFISSKIEAQIEPTAGNWKTWFISSAKDLRISAASSFKNEIAEVIAVQKSIDAASLQQIEFWNAGSPGYQWQQMMSKQWMSDTTASGNGVLANMLLATCIYDATIVAWDSKYAYNRPRPFEADKRIKLFIVKPESPGYPCEHSVAGGVAVAIFSHFYPSLADSVKRMAEKMMLSRIAAGAAFPSDTRAGYELGKRIAEKEIEYCKDFTNKTPWDRKMPTEAGVWKGKNPMFPLAGKNKTVVLTTASEFRPGPPPDFTKEMEELKNFKQTFRSMSNAFFWANQPFWDDVLHKKIFEHNLHLNPPKASRLYALAAIGFYDGFVACWDAKYTYWGIRPGQLDTTFKAALFFMPPFPGYPSGHASVSGLSAELYSYFFPADAAYFRQKAKDAAESRFQGGIHFRTDNEVGLELGKKVAMKIIEKAKSMED